MRWKLKVWSLMWMIMALNCPLLAQSLVWETVELPSNSDLKGVFVAGDHFVAYGEEGSVFASQDGRNWLDVSPPVEAELSTGLSFQGSWIVSSRDAGVWLTSDQGQTWIEAAMPEQDGGVLLPGLIGEIDGRLMAIGELSNDPSPACWGTVAFSDNGLDWTIEPELAVYPTPQRMVAVDGGLLFQRVAGGLPCFLPPYIAGVLLEFAQLNGWTELEFILSIGLAPDTSWRPGYIWHGDKLWVVGRSTISQPPIGPLVYSDWIRRMAPTQRYHEVPSIELNRRALGLASYGDRVIVSHLGHVSFVDTQGNVDEQPLPIADEPFAFASKGEVLVGVGAGGFAVRGGPAFSIGVPAVGPFALVVLVLLCGIAAVRRLLSGIKAETSTS